MRLLYPKMLSSNKKIKTIEMLKKQRAKKLQENYPDIPVNKLDANVFKYHTKSMRVPAAVIRRDEKTPSPAKSPRKKKYYWVKSRYMKKSFQGTSGGNIQIKKS